MLNQFSSLVTFIREVFGTSEFIPLHAPVFAGNERNYVLDAIDSTFVSSVGKYVDQFEAEMARAAGTKYAVAVVNGTEALHIALRLAGVTAGDEVITQPLTFVATANAIQYLNAHHVFLDVDKLTLGLSPDALLAFLSKHCEKNGGECRNRTTGRRVAACVPVHIFGHAVRIDEIAEICRDWNLALIEDAAEAIGSSFKNKPMGGFGLLGTFSFNGNKTITCGGGGAIVTNDETLAKLGKHLTTTAKVPHKWEYAHDYTGYNYRLPNLNAALACAQLEQLSNFIRNKRDLAALYREHLQGSQALEFIDEPSNSKSNFWLNAVCLPDLESRNAFLDYTNSRGVMTRPCWQLMNRLPMYKSAFTGDLPNCEWLEARIVNIPSSFRPL